MSVGRYPGKWNLAEFGAPATGPFGDALNAAISGFDPSPRAAVPYSVDPGRQTIINRAAFLPAKTYKFRELYGPFVARPAANIMVPAATHGYRGIFPLEEQPALNKPRPWRDRTLPAG